ncbi:MAG TPA: class I lanthipeptide [Frankiaceae bacterium]|nr:class I lanthipeptide [Frankiaceae bacterium]
MRKLTLKKDTLAELTTDELGGVVGGTFPSKFDCTVSHQVCLDDVVASLRPCLPTYAHCVPTQTC